MTDRTVYDLCRKYKYYYSAVRELKQVDGKYWNKHLRKALKDAEDNLAEVTDELLTALISPYLGEVNIDIESPIPTVDMFGRFHRCISNGRYETTVTGKEFAEMMKNILIRKGHYYG